MIANITELITEVYKAFSVFWIMFLGSISQKNLLPFNYNDFKTLLIYFSHSLQKESGYVLNAEIFLPLPEVPCLLLLIMETNAINC